LPPFASSGRMIGEIVAPTAGNASELTPERLAGRNGGTPEQWANDSARLAQAAWVQDGTDLDEGYYQREIKVVDRQMTLAGLRLAKLLNGTIGRMTRRDFR